MSKLEDYIVSILRKIYPSTRFIREFPVKKLFKEYPSGRDRYDIVVKTFKTIFECHGEQHERIVSFGKESAFEAVRRFSTQKFRDSEKERIAKENNWTYVIIWYSEITNKFDADVEIIKQKIKESI